MRAYLVRKWPEKHHQEAVREEGLGEVGVDVGLLARWGWKSLFQLPTPAA